MSTEQTWQTNSTSSEATIELAAAIGLKLRGGEVIELISDLGGGKTTFVRGLAGGLGSKDKVSSPSFTLNNQYRAGKLTLHHFDFYRLHEPGIMREELAEATQDKQAMVVVEWGEIVEDVLPNNRLIIHIKATGEHSRELTFNYPKSLEHLLSKT